MQPDRPGFRLAFVGSLMSLSLATAVAQMHGDDVHAGPTMNYHKIDERLSTGGHFVDGGLASVHEMGIEVVIDLRDKPPAGQQEKLAALGIEWIHVPVVWKNPRPLDFERFSEAMSTHKDKKVLVQCQANYRASAMTYLYRVTVEQVPESLAERDLHAVWTPDGRWRDYIDSIAK
jgi:protein tyrosine phosphatase (PTP) superfamily phosphohydrolase (DUF442 family)